MFGLLADNQSVVYRSVDLCIHGCELSHNVVLSHAVMSGGDSLKQKLDSISDTVTDNVRETGALMMQCAVMMIAVMLWCKVHVTCH